MDRYGEEYYAQCRKQGIVENPTGPETGSCRVLRGGGWDGHARGCRSADRRYYFPDYRYFYIGFRLVFVPESVADHLTMPMSWDELLERNERGARDAAPSEWSDNNESRSFSNKP